MQKEVVKKGKQNMKCAAHGENMANQPSDLSSFTAVISVPDFDSTSLIQFCLLRTLIIIDGGVLAPQILLLNWQEKSRTTNS